ncbi:PilZ domain-containing protein [Sphingomonas sinipercae]|uniref:PilZ domain-containing protein n=1 Tax=Sphingomonas sinipercae TaxID=2714944 RepID=A0A6G7ZP60_9SPHN|nr:PilZ domain-containing protein [Sphingomonas sinipercae]QIL02712.1 PilZ domain-containing protein [Sphingomonas sinipercae]
MTEFIGVARQLDSGFMRALTQTKRKSARVPLAAEVNMRRTGRFTHSVTIHDLSREGCSLKFLERPELDERVWIKFDALESLEASVCWVDDKSVGVEFVNPIYPAVFDFLVKRVNG